jgi:hypothetical protein
MAHWADSYVGLPGCGPFPCWDLVRRVWAERAGVIYPSFRDTGARVAVIAGQARKGREIGIGLERELDAVIMTVPLRQGLGWISAPAHLGVVAAPGLVLHVQEGALSQIDPLAGLGVVRIVRMPL